MLISLIRQIDVNLLDSIWIWHLLLYAVNINKISALLVFLSFVVVRATFLFYFRDFKGEHIVYTQNICLLVCHLFAPRSERDVSTQLSRLWMEKWFFFILFTCQAWLFIITLHLDTKDSSKCEWTWQHGMKWNFEQCYFDFILDNDDEMIITQTVTCSVNKVFHKNFNIVTACGSEMQPSLIEISSSTSSFVSISITKINLKLNKVFHKMQLE